MSNFAHGLMYIDWEGEIGCTCGYRGDDVFEHFEDAARADELRRAARDLEAEGHDYNNDQVSWLRSRADTLDGNR